MTKCPIVSIIEMAYQRHNRLVCVTFNTKELA